MAIQPEEDNELTPEHITDNQCLKVIILLLAAILAKTPGPPGD